MGGEAEQQEPRFDYDWEAGEAAEEEDTTALARARAPYIDTSKGKRRAASVVSNEGRTGHHRTSSYPSSSAGPQLQPPFLVKNLPPPPPPLEDPSIARSSSFPDHPVVSLGRERQRQRQQRRSSEEGIRISRDGVVAGRVEEVEHHGVEKSEQDKRMAAPETQSTRTSPTVRQSKLLVSVELGASQGPAAGPHHRHRRLSDSHPASASASASASGLAAATSTITGLTPTPRQTSFSEFSLDIRVNDQQRQQQHGQDNDDDLLLPRIPVLSSKNLLRTNPSLESTAKDLQKRMARLRRATSRLG